MIYERHNTFDTDEEAQDYLDELMKAPTDSSQNLENNELENNEDEIQN